MDVAEAEVTTVQVMVASPREAHQVLNNLYQQVVKPHTRTGARGVLTWQTESSYRREQLYAAFHGPILKAFREQVWFTDEESGRRFRYSKEAWKQYLKQEFCPVKFEERINRQTGEVEMRELELSLTNLSDDELQLFLTEVQAFGINDLGIVFEEEGY